MIPDDCFSTRLAEEEYQAAEMRRLFAQAYLFIPPNIPTEAEVDEMARLDDLKRHKGTPHEL